MLAGCLFGTLQYTPSISILICSYNRRAYVSCRVVLWIFCRLLENDKNKNKLPLVIKTSLKWMRGFVSNDTRQETAVESGELRRYSFEQATMMRASPVDGDSNQQREPKGMHSIILYHSMLRKQLYGTRQNISLFDTAESARKIGIFQ